ncbi:MAG: phosphate ABC transporter permease PstA [Prolixibacteraceae bacterium]|jgi:phosphate transport system permease protein|nr:phosphate ABC transporter permease PstA [Prolixibacteraceae bacterium]
MRHLRIKRIEEKIFKGLMIIATLTIVVSLFLILVAIIRRGLPVMNWDMVSKIPSGGFYLGKEGGLLNAIVGSLYIVLGSLVLGLAFSLPIVLYINLYLPENSKLAQITRLSFDVLFGIPSIVYGAFGFTIMVYLGLRSSLLAGILAVTMLIIPILIRSIDEVVRRVPKEMKDAALSLGATRSEIIWVILRQVSPGIMTAILLSVGRGIGDAASVLFTAGYTDSIPTSLGQPVATLPLAIFFQLSSPIAEVQDRAYAAALILTLIVLALSIAGRLYTRKFSKNKI